jgi:hypothetical protein
VTMTSRFVNYKRLGSLQSNYPQWPSLARILSRYYPCFPTVHLIQLSKVFFAIILPPLGVFLEVGCRGILVCYYFPPYLFCQALSPIPVPQYILDSVWVPVSPIVCIRVPVVDQPLTDQESSMVRLPTASHTLRF